MIISLHLPKTGGNSFRVRLRGYYGQRALFDYGDQVGVDTPQAIEHRERRMLDVRARQHELARDYDVIHGHFVPDKYLGLFESAQFAAFLRDPYQQTMSHYDFFLRHPEIKHPAVKRFHEMHMTLLEFIEALPNPQTRFLGSLTVDDLAVVGPAEQYERVVALFNAVFGCTLSTGLKRENANPKHQAAYVIDTPTREAVERHRAADVEAYRRACERFESLADRYGV